jgi:hypothetical protein
MALSQEKVVLLVLLSACDRSAPTPPPPPAPSVTPAASVAPAASAVVDAATEPRFEAVVGDWREEEAGGVKGFAVDGTKWSNGTPSANLADQAKKLYGDRYAEFLDGVKAFAFFPLAVARDEPPAGDFEISVRFYPIAGKIDQGAGIAFGIAPDGSYWGVRANALEDNLLWFHVVKGKRTVIDTVRNVPTPSRTWHTLSVSVTGKKLEAMLDGTKRFEKTLDAVPQGRVGLWSKADSHVLFDDFKIRDSSRKEGGTK